MDYVPPSSFYDIYPNDFLHWNFAAPGANNAGEAPEETPRYGLEYPGGVGPAPVPTTPAEAPAFQFPAPVERTFRTDSSTTPSTLSSQSPPPPGSSVSPPMLSSQDLTQLTQMQDVSLPAVAADAPPSTKRRTKKRNGPPRRRGPNRRLKGSGYFDMMRELPEAVQNAITQEYPDCCEVVAGKDPSTVQKHRFAKRHFNKIDPQYQPFLPAFTCPAYAGLDDKCKSAKAGRYDSTERHCNNCPGFRKLQAGTFTGVLYPFVITKQQFDALHEYRKTHAPNSPVDDAPIIIIELLERLRIFLVGRETKYEEDTASSSASQLLDIPADATPAAESSSQSLSPPPVDPSSSAQPQQLLQFMPEESAPIYDFAGNGGAVSQQDAAATSLIDPFGTWNAFAPGGPGFFFGPPYGLYPANPSAWPNVTYDPATFDPATYDPAIFGPLF